MEQITIFQWQEWKEEIRRKLQETTDSFIQIGYKLKQIRNSEAFRQDGYEDIFEFAFEEYGLSKSVTSRFIAINDKFSLDGNGEVLNPEYEGIGSSKLSEMLTLTDAECQMITKETTVKEIRELKRMDRQQDTEEQQEDNRIYSPLEKTIIDYFSDQKRMDNLNEIMRLMMEEVQSEENDRKAAYEINPSGYATHKKGIVFLFMYDFEKGVKYKVMGQNNPESMMYTEFLCLILDIYRKYYGLNTWTSFYGLPVEKEEKKAVDNHNENVKKSQKTSVIKPVATSQQNDEKVEEKQPDAESEEVEKSEENDQTEQEEDIEESETEEELGENETDSQEGRIEPDRCEKVENQLPEGVEDLPLWKLIVDAKELSESIYQYCNSNDNFTTEEYIRVQKKNAEQLAAVLEQLIELKKEDEE